jgi:hypothetical protein
MAKWKETPSPKTIVRAALDSAAFWKAVRERLEMANGK